MRGADPPVGVGRQMKLCRMIPRWMLKLVVDMADVPMVITDEMGVSCLNGHTLDIVGKPKMSA